MLNLDGIRAAPLFLAVSEVRQRIALTAADNYLAVGEFLRQQSATD